MSSAALRATAALRARQRCAAAHPAAHPPALRSHAYRFLHAPKPTQSASDAKAAPSTGRAALTLITSPSGGHAFCSGFVCSCVFGVAWWDCRKIRQWARHHSHMHADGRGRDDWFTWVVCVAAVVQARQDAGCGGLGAAAHPATRSAAALRWDDRQVR